MKKETTSKKDFKEFLEKGKSVLSSLPLHGSLNRKLQIAYSKKEKVEKWITNSEKLKKEGKVTESQYKTLKADHDKLYQQVISEIEKIKERTKMDLEGKENDLKTLLRDLENLKARLKVGEITENDYQNSEQNIKSNTEKKEKEILTLKNLLQAKSSSGLGGYLDVPVEKSEGKQGLSALSNISTLLSKKPVIIGIIIVLILVVVIITLKGKGWAGEYANTTNENSVITLKKDKTFSATESGIGIQGTYKVKGDKITLEMNMYGATVSMECEKVKNGFDCPKTGDKYRKK